MWVQTTLIRQKMRYYNATFDEPFFSKKWEGVEQFGKNTKGPPLLFFAKIGIFENA